MSPGDGNGDGIDCYASPNFCVSANSTSAINVYSISEFQQTRTLKVWLLFRVEEQRTRHQNGLGKRDTLSLIYDKCMQQ